MPRAFLFRWMPALICLFFLSCFSGSDTKDNDGGTAQPGELIGPMWHTYYWLTMEKDFSPGDDYTLVGVDCEPLADVSEEFFFSLCDEGAGILKDGRLINNDSICDCAPLCQWGYGFCFAEIDRKDYPWGIGAIDNPVEPLRSWAVDNDLIPHGTVLYAPFWDGKEMPSSDGLGGFVHDGCFRADDHDPNRVTGNHYDFYAGTRTLAILLDALVPNGEFALIDVYLDDGRCAYLTP